MVAWKIMRKSFLSKNKMAAGLWFAKLHLKAAEDFWGIDETGAEPMDQTSSSVFKIFWSQT